MLARVFVDAGRDDGFDERRHQGARGRHIDRAVEADDATKGRERIRVAGTHVGLGGAGAGRHAARIRVLDHRGGRFAELEHDAQRRVEIEEVVVRQLLALQDGGVAEPVARILGVPGGALMRDSRRSEGPAPSAGHACGTPESRSCVA